MANSMYQYVRAFELSDAILRDCWIVVRLDGRGFHRFTKDHKFTKPNDPRGLGVMNRAAMAVMKHWSDCLLSYGQSDEYSFLLDKKTTVFGRRSSKITSSIVSLFSSSYVFYWKDFFGSAMPLLYPPTFDARIVLYPSNHVLQDYFRWRQVDCHINNLYNTCFWNLVERQGLTEEKACEKLKGTDSGMKNELLFSQFSINYNDVEPIYRKGSILVKSKGNIELLHCDLIKQAFWDQHALLDQNLTLI